MTTPPRRSSGADGATPPRAVPLDDHPDPIWILDGDTLRFLEVNDAAVTRHGYSRAEFAAMCATDLLWPEERRPAPRTDGPPPHAPRPDGSRPDGSRPDGKRTDGPQSDDLQSDGSRPDGPQSDGQQSDGQQSNGPQPDAPPPGDLRALRAALLDGAGDRHWRHRVKVGPVLDTTLVARPIDHEGRPALLVSLRDLTAPMAREREARAAAERTARRYEALFHAVPGKIAVLSADAHEIVAMSDAYLRATGARRPDLIGRRVFDLPHLLPGGADDLAASFARVLDTGLEDVMVVQRRAPLAGDATPPGAGGPQFWNVVNTPVRDADGEIVHLIHRIDDITGLMGAGAEPEPAQPEGDPAMQLAWDILLRSQELQAANTRLREQEANLRTAQRLLGIGTWRLDLTTLKLDWSDNLYALYGVTRDGFGHDLDAYGALVHPDDRRARARAFEAFLAARAMHYTFDHRVIRPDGSTAHVRGVGEVTRLPQGPVLAGVVQDITAQVAADAQLREAVEMARLSGRMARLGSWRIDVPSRMVHWSPVTASIHGAPEGHTPSLDEGLTYFAPADRDRIAAVVARCVETGAPFDEILQIQPLSGPRVWVRSIGEAERDAGGAVTAVKGALQDISELVAARSRSDDLARRLSQTLDHMSDAFCTLDAEWRFSYLNAEAERVLQRGRDTLLGHGIWDMFPDARGTLFQTEYERAVATGRSVRFTAYYPAPLDAWLEVTAHPTPEGLALYFRDVTAERARGEHLLRLEAAVARINDVVLITEAEPIDQAEGGPKIVYVNDAFERLTGYTRDEAIGATPRLLQGPRTDRAELDRIRAALERWEPVRAELINYTKAGEECWIELDITPIRDPSGTFVQWFAVQRDITERKRDEQALAVSEERFRLISATGDQAIWDWDVISGVLWSNEVVERIFGFAPALHGPRSWRARLHPEDRDRVVDGLAAAMAGGARDWRVQYRFLRPDGRTVVVADRGHFIRDADGRAVRMVGSMSDVTLELEEGARRRQSQKLEAMGQLTGGIAHDFNNLLAVILGNGELLAEMTADPLQRSMAEMTVAAAERGAALTGRLLAFARRQPLEPRQVDVNALVGSLEAMLGRTLPADIEIDCRRAPDLWPAEVDPGQLEAALLNLALNARDAMPGGGRLIIETANDWLDDAYATQNPEVTAGAFVRISVIDTGAGMTPEVIERAFEPFFTTKEAGQGSGLGLSMVYGFVRQSGGHVKVHSAPGHGTVFRLHFPRAGEDAAAPEAPEEAAPPVGGDERILVVEDDAFVRGGLARQLVHLGYDVLTASNGDEAFEILRDRADIDLLFTDVVMPGGMDGRQLADAVRALRPGFRVLFTSGYPKDAIVHHGRLDHGVDLLSKPYRRHELAAKLRKVLDA